MSERMLIRNARLWPAPDRPAIDDGALLVEDGRIARVGRFRARAGQVIDAGGALLMPGLVQTHVHCCQALFRGLAEDAALLPWLQRYVWPLEAAHDEDTLRISAELACAEMIRGGTTAFLSFETTRHTAAVLAAVEASGLAGLVSHTLMDDPEGFRPLVVPLDEALEECDRLRRAVAGQDRFGLAVAPRFALSCTEACLRGAAEYARAHGLLIHTHAAEQREEVTAVRRRTGMANIEYLHALGLSGPDVGLAHCVHPEPREMDLLADTDTRVLHCPSANQKLGSGIAPIVEYLEAGILVSLGADGAPCNNRMDAFQEMRAAALLQKLRRGPRALPARDAVRMATVNGARTLGLDGVTGTLEPGAWADLILVETQGVHALPSEDPAATLVYACAAGDVVLTMVRGRVLFENGALTTIDEEALRDRAWRARGRLLARAGLA